jgi:hypothetical protein
MSPAAASAARFSLRPIGDYLYPVGTRSSDAHSSMNIGNLFTAAEPPAQGERFKELLSCRNLRIERIVSSSSIVSSDYNQEQDEWSRCSAARPRSTSQASASTFVRGTTSSFPPARPIPCSALRCTFRGGDGFPVSAAARDLRLSSQEQIPRPGLITAADPGDHDVDLGDHDTPNPHCMPSSRR